jgi:hypothetical protein
MKQTTDCIQRAARQDKSQFSVYGFYSSVSCVWLAALKIPDLKFKLYNEVEHDGVRKISHRHA